MIDRTPQYIWMCRKAIPLLGDFGFENLHPGDAFTIPVGGKYLVRPYHPDDVPPDTSQCVWHPRADQLFEEFMADTVAWWDFDSMCRDAMKQLYNAFKLSEREPLTVSRKLTKDKLALVAVMRHTKGMEWNGESWKEVTQ